MPDDDVRRPAEGAGSPPLRVTLPLLTLITQQSLDEDYLHAAERRARAGDDDPDRSPSRPHRPHRITAVVVAVFGILVTTAAVQTSRNEDVDAASRSTLVQRITDERDRVGDLQERVVRLREGNADLERGLTEAQGTQQGVVTRLRRLQVRTGFVPVTGPGIRVVLDDGPPESPENLVRDRDLRLVANGLFRLGAEAIAVNGQRLTALSAIRNSGTVVRVNRVNLSPPYTVAAIGDRRTLQADFLDSPEGVGVAGLEGPYGITFDMSDDDSVELPGARLRELREAVELESSRPQEEAP